MLPIRSNRHTLTLSNTDHEIPELVGRTDWINLPTTRAALEHWKACALRGESKSGSRETPDFFLYKAGYQAIPKGKLYLLHAERHRFTDGKICPKCR